MGMMGTRVTAKPSQIRMFLRADTAEELVRLQLQTNVRLKGRADYTDITFSDGQWYCWFLVDIDDSAVAELVGAIVRGNESDSRR